MFLKPLSRKLKRFTHNNLNCGIEISLSKILSSEEFIARFCFDRDFYAETGNPKPNVFMPELFQDKHETSVCRKTNISEERIWEISRIVEVQKKKKPIGRADLSVFVVLEKNLTAESAPDMKLNYPEHSIIIGWPAGQEETEKAKRKSIAQELAYKAKPVKIPSL